MVHIKHPYGWYKIAWSNEVSQNKLTQVKYLGQNFIVFRDQSNKAHVLDAYCPHLGANLGIKGKLYKNRIECPFHGWCFNEEGNCIGLPNHQKVPNVKIRSYPTQEQNGMVLAFVSSLKDHAPFELPSLVEKSEQKWSKLTKFNMIFRSPIMNIMENIFDIAHFGTVHRFLEFPKISELVVENNRFRMSITSKRKLAGMTAETSTEIECIGPALAVIKNLSPIRFVTIAALTPISEETLELNLCTTFEKTKNPLKNIFLNFFLPTMVKIEAIADGPIQENRKATHFSPHFSENDATLIKFIRWYSRFYNVPQDNP